jgi:hypothetical protein
MHLYIRGPELFSWYSDRLRAGRSRDRIPLGARFSAAVHTGPGAHPASYIMGTGSFTGIKQPGPGVVHPPPSNAEIKKRVKLYLYSPSEPLWPVLVWNLFCLNYTGKETHSSLKKKPGPVTFCPLQTPHRLTWDRARFFSIVIHNNVLGMAGASRKGQISCPKTSVTS